MQVVALLFCLLQAGHGFRSQIPSNGEALQSSKMQSLASLLFGMQIQPGAHMHKFHSRSKSPQMQVLMEELSADMQEKLAVLGVQPGEKVESDLVAALEDATLEELQDFAPPSESDLEKNGEIGDVPSIDAISVVADSNAEKIEKRIAQVEARLASLARKGFVITEEQFKRMDESRIVYDKFENLGKDTMKCLAMACRDASDVITDGMVLNAIMTRSKSGSPILEELGLSAEKIREAAGIQMTTTTTAAPVDLAPTIKAKLPVIKERIRKEGKENVNAIIADVLGADAPQYVDEQALRQMNRDMARQIAERERAFAKGEYESSEGPKISFPEGLVTIFGEAEKQRLTMEEESVEPHHLLLGMAEDPTSVLSKLGVSKTALLAAVQKEKAKQEEDEDDKDETWSESLMKEDMAEYLSKLSTEAPPEMSLEDEVNIIYELFYAP
mmetsp:Transcript_76078/g.118871  ORF Transcript_76078/g.118871 Transcript_76078/m.118871 type:complete len:442 (-) Transcript_76078:268-1593(-)